MNVNKDNGPLLLKKASEVSFGDASKGSFIKNICNCRISLKLL